MGGLLDRLTVLTRTERVFTGSAYTFSLLAGLILFFFTPHKSSFYLFGES
jgi:hypothetical protein